MYTNNPLKTWRETHGLSVAQLALLADVGGQIIYGIESGERYRLHPRVLGAITVVDGPEVADRIVAEYGTWRSARSAEVLRSLTTAAEG